LQPAATAGNLGRIQGRLLQLGHPHRYRRHHRHVGVAANGLTAIAIVGQELGFIAHPNLAELNAGLIFASKILDQVAEIHSLFRQEVKNNTLAAEEVFDVDQFHLELALRNEILASKELLPFVLMKLVEADKVRGGQRAEDLATGRFAQEFHGLWAGTSK